MTIGHYPRDEYPQREWTDVMQLCLNGHQITDEVKADPDRMKKFCPACGAATITQCPKCNGDIPGFRHGSGSIKSAPVAECCENCGEPYPWKMNMAKEGLLRLERIRSNKVFIVHGHDDHMKEAVARVLSQLDLDPIILHEQPNKGRTIIEKFEDYSDVGFAVVLLSGDDMAYSASVEHKKAKPKPRARQNVILELGFFLGKLGRDKVVGLHKQAADFEYPSDYQGVIWVPFDPLARWHVDLVKELKAAGYDVDANKLIKSK